MKKHWIEFQDAQPYCPMTSWVHRSVDGKPWFEAQTLDPPRQTAVPGKGFPVFKVAFDAIGYSHKGPMSNIRQTINSMYNAVIPDAGLNSDLNRSMIHFERYDTKFKWNRRDSIIDIYVPLMTQNHGNQL